MQGLENKTAVVTGGGGGIGSAICRRLAEAGARVAVLDLDAAAARQVAEACAATGGNASGFACDITDRAAVESTITAVEAKFGPSHVLVNNAGWDRAMPFLKTTPGLWERIIAINLVGHLNLHHVVAPGMQDRQAGSIVNVASDAGRVGSSGEAVYAACKGGMIAFSKAMARELARAHVRVNAVCPGPTDTALFRDFTGAGERGEKLKAALERASPFGRLGRPEEVAGAVAFLASAESEFITGQVLSVSGGLTMNG